ncbi:hypothetical protein B0J11DRAFT_502214 [Dendryphion nanum]|uniref:Uncharacterized protein n=1 Tax=Dendryphion nanum TaxID=256645 RepID=A0A9P9EBM5_9PLEO|nr:hypothetical protein B0J11DRAFT_502214 [Dendryphion nanum]
MFTSFATATAPGGDRAGKKRGREDDESDEAEYQPKKHRSGETTSPTASGQKRSREEEDEDNEAAYRTKKQYRGGEMTSPAASGQKRSRDDDEDSDADYQPKKHRGGETTSPTASDRMSEYDIHGDEGRSSPAPSSEYRPSPPPPPGDSDMEEENWNVEPEDEDDQIPVAVLNNIDQMLLSSDAAVRSLAATRMAIRKKLRRRYSKMIHFIKRHGIDIFITQVENYVCEEESDSGFLNDLAAVAESGIFRGNEENPEKYKATAKAHTVELDSIIQQKKYHSVWAWMEYVFEYGTGLGRDHPGMHWIFEDFVADDGANEDGEEIDWGQGADVKIPREVARLRFVPQSLKKFLVEEIDLDERLCVFRIKIHEKLRCLVDICDGAREEFAPEVEGFSLANIGGAAKCAERIEELVYDEDLTLYDQEIRPVVKLIKDMSESSGLDDVWTWLEYLHSTFRSDFADMPTRDRRAEANPWKGLRLMNPEELREKEEDSIVVVNDKSSFAELTPVQPTVPDTVTDEVTVSQCGATVHPDPAMEEDSIPQFVSGPAGPPYQHDIVMDEDDIRQPAPAAATAGLPTQLEAVMEEDYVRQSSSDPAVVPHWSATATANRPSQQDSGSMEIDQAFPHQASGNPSGAPVQDEDMDVVLAPEDDKDGKVAYELLDLGYIEEEETIMLLDKPPQDEQVPVVSPAPAPLYPVHGVVDTEPVQAQSTVPHVDMDHLPFAESTFSPLAAPSTPPHLVEQSSRPCLLPPPAAAAAAINTPPHIVEQAVASSPSPIPSPTSNKPGPAVEPPVPTVPMTVQTQLDAIRAELVMMLKAQDEAHRAQLEAKDKQIAALERRVAVLEGRGIQEAVVGEVPIVSVAQGTETECGPEAIRIHEERVVDSAPTAAEQVATTRREPSPSPLATAVKTEPGKTVPPPPPAPAMAPQTTEQQESPLFTPIRTFVSVWQGNSPSLAEITPLHPAHELGSMIFATAVTITDPADPIIPLLSAQCSTLLTLLPLLHEFASQASSLLDPNCAVHTALAALAQQTYLANTELDASGGVATEEFVSLEQGIEHYRRWIRERVGEFAAATADVSRVVEAVSGDQVLEDYREKIRDCLGGFLDQTVAYFEGIVGRDDEEEEEEEEDGGGLDHDVDEAYLSMAEKLVSLPSKNSRHPTDCHEAHVSLPSNCPPRVYLRMVQKLSSPRPEKLVSNYHPKKLLFFSRPRSSSFFSSRKPRCA